MFVLMLTSLSRLAVDISGRGGQGGLRHLHLQGASGPVHIKSVDIPVCCSRKGLRESMIRIYSIRDKSCIVLFLPFELRDRMSCDC